jgi:hypothetical protein
MAIGVAHYPTHLAILGSSQRIKKMCHPPNSNDDLPQ